MPRIPTIEDFLKYKGAHCHRLWAETGSNWICPACNRNKYQILRWTTRFPNSPNKFQDWHAGLHKHHDHSVPYFSTQTPRFEQTIICDQCNSSDGAVKRKLSLPKDFSFSPFEIMCFVEPTPHGKHVINHEAARQLFQSISSGLLQKLAKQ